MHVYHADGVCCMLDNSAELVADLCSLREEAGSTVPASVTMYHDAVEICRSIARGRYPRSYHAET